MQFRFIELIETEKFQFLRIYKNGNSSVMTCILMKDLYQD